VRRTLSTWGPSLLAALVALTVACIAVESIALLARAHDGAAPAPAGLSRLLDPWNRWDVDWYLQIARDGYAGTGRVSPLDGAFQEAIAFPPLFPLSIRAVSSTFALSPLVAASVIDLLCLLAALTGLHRLARLDSGGRAPALTIVALLSFPTAFFLIAPYAESMLLALAVWSFLAARSGRWGIAGLLAGTAVLVKVHAVLLVAALLVEVATRPGTRRRLLAAAWVIVPSVVALGSWMGYQAWLVGDPLRFLHAERAWGRSPSPPLWFVYNGPYLPDINLRDVLPLVLDTATPLLLIAAGIYAFLRVRRSYGVLLVLSALAFASTSNHFSVSRYALGVFPLFIVLGRLYAARPRLGTILALMSAALGGVETLLFVTDWFVG
jgi:hypothetical protein